MAPATSVCCDCSALRSERRADQCITPKMPNTEISTMATIGMMIAFAIWPPEILDELNIHEPGFFGPSIVGAG